MNPIGGVPERPKGADCKSAVVDFEGSNPSPSTIIYLPDEERCHLPGGEKPYGLEMTMKLSPTKRFVLAGVAQLARASAFQAEGRGFEPRFPLQNK